MREFSVRISTATQPLFDSGRVNRISIEGHDGLFTVLPGHETMMAALRNPAKITVLYDDEKSEFEVKGGVALVAKDGVTIITNR